MAQLVKNPPLWGDLGLIPQLGRSPGEGKGYSLQYPGLENSADCIVHESRTQPSDFHSLNVISSLKHKYEVSTLNTITVLWYIESRHCKMRDNAKIKWFVSCK